MDALSEVLRLASLTGSVLADATAGGAWCVSVPAASSRAFAHVVLEGDCALKAGEAEPVALRTGDVAFLARGESHLLGSDLAAEATPFASLLRPPVAGELAPGHARRIGPAHALGDARHLGRPAPRRAALRGAAAGAQVGPARHRAARLAFRFAGAVALGHATRRGPAGRPRSRAWRSWC